MNRWSFNVSKPWLHRIVTMNLGGTERCAVRTPQRGVATGRSWKGIPVLVSVALLAGCRPDPTVQAEADSATTALPQFSVKRGLLLPELTRQALGLKVVEVTERKIASHIEIPLRVYQATSGSAVASGTIAPEHSKRLPEGLTVEVLVGEGTLKGKILRVDHELQAATGSDEVLVEITDIGDRLPVGAFVQARAPIESTEHAATIPRAALLQCSEGQYVYTVSGEHLVRTAVKVGASDKEWIEITEGLYAGDQVVLQPVMSLWLTELAAVKGGQACCVEPPKGK